jgi:hypothetical protein
MNTELGEYQNKMLEYLKSSQVDQISGARFKERDPVKGNITYLEFVTSYRSVWCPELVGEPLMKDMYEMIHADSMPIRFNDSHDYHNNVPLIGEWKDATIPCLEGLRRINEKDEGLSKYQVKHLLEYVEALEDACRYWRMAE